MGFGMSEMDINSHEYWNGRFDRDWESNLGREQSRFFAKMALDNLPVWLTAAVKNDNWSVCDWGCAQGDGTVVLADFFARNRVTGIDFAESAVAKARAAYPAVHFDAQDWLRGDGQHEKFDLVFSSNTLEHFSEPFNIIQDLFRHAEHSVVLTLPYRELDRIAEHFYTFLSENIPMMPNPDWLLGYAKVIDCRSMDPTYWHGEQIILVYVKKIWMESKGLVLADFLGDDIAISIDAAETSCRLQAAHVENVRLVDEVAKMQAALHARHEEVELKAGQVETLERQIGALNGELTVIKIAIHGV